MNNATTKHFANIGGIVGSDEVWFNKGDRRYYAMFLEYFGILRSYRFPLAGLRR